MPKGRTGRNAGNRTDFRCPQAVVGRIRRENPSAVGISRNKGRRAATHFAIHDGARALITPEDIQSRIGRYLFWRFLLGVPVKDTIKVVDGEGYVQGTPNRALMWNVQTPQVFEKSRLSKGYEKSGTGGADYTEVASWSRQLGVGFISAWAPMKI